MGVWTAPSTPWALSLSWTESAASAAIISFPLHTHTLTGSLNSHTQALQAASKLFWVSSCDRIMENLLAVQGYVISRYNNMAWVKSQGILIRSQKCSLLACIINILFSDLMGKPSFRRSTHRFLGRSWTHCTQYCVCGSDCFQQRCINRTTAEIHSFYPTDCFSTCWMFHRFPSAEHESVIKQAANSKTQTWTGNPVWTALKKRDSMRFHFELQPNVFPIVSFL